jgi:V/A-type H+-transporting ATPase subunit E
MEQDMTDQLQELLTRVYEEGVNKAKTEADALLEKARAEAATLIQQAQNEAEKITADAKKQAAELAKNTDSDLKMAAQQTLSAVKQKLTDVFLDKAFDPDLKAATTDPAFLKTLIPQIISAWKESGGKITLAKDLEGKLEDHFLKTLQGSLAKGLQVEFSPQMKTGFAISPADGSYKLSFTDEDFGNLFKSYLRPRTNKILFQQ